MKRTKILDLVPGLTMVNLNFQLFLLSFFLLCRTMKYHEPESWKFGKVLLACNQADLSHLKGFGHIYLCQLVRTDSGFQSRVS